MKNLICSIILISSLIASGAGIYIVSGGDFRLPAATAKIIVENTNDFMFAKNIYARSNFSIKVKSFNEIKFTSGTYTNVMMECSTPGIHNVNIYDKDKKLWYFNFLNCTNIIEFNFPDYCDNNNSWEGIFNNSSIQKVHLPPVIARIGGSMFQSCKNLRYIELPESVKVINDNAFYASGVNTISLPNTIETIGRSAFAWGELVSITLPDSVHTIGGNCFEACDSSLNKSTNSLIYVKLSNSMTNIPRRCFNSSKHLKTVIMPTNLKTIEEEAFISASEINNLVFPTTIETIGANAFKSASKFTNVYFRGTLDQYKNNSALVQAFGSVPVGTEPSNNTILLNTDGLYSTPRKTLYFNYSE